MASPLEMGGPYTRIGLGDPQEKPRETALQKCAQKCKSAAKKAFDVLSLIGGLALMAGGGALIIGEKAGVEANRFAGGGAFFLGLIIVTGNVKHIRDWQLDSCF